jgi:hypothetical protein
MTSLLLKFKTGQDIQIDGENFTVKDEHLVLDNILIPKVFLDAGEILG